jgi:glycerophosphoryl diester phosphodiesterase
VTRPRTGFPFLDAGLDQPGTVLAIAHRGGAFHPDVEGLENSLAAFDHAVKLGYQYLETDVHATKDGVLLAFHDAVLDRVTGSQGVIAELSHAEAAHALIDGREHIPTLTDLLELFPQTRFNIDIKSDAAVAPLAEMLTATGSLDRVCIASFSESRINAFRRLVGPSVPTGCTPISVAAHLFLPRIRLFDVLRGKGVVLQVPRRRGRLTIVTPGFVTRAHANGVPVHVWTIDEPDEMNELLDMDVDGLITDRTDVLRDVLIARGQWMGVA